MSDGRRLHSALAGGEDSTTHRAILFASDVWNEKKRRI